MAKKTFNQNAAIRGAIRRIFSRSPVIREVMMSVRKEFPKFNKDGSRAKKDAVCYLCNICKEYAGSTHVAVDHIIPVISTDDGFQDWNTFVDRLFCDKTNLQVICDPCHNKKTNIERAARSNLKDAAELERLKTEMEGKPSVARKKEILKKVKSMSKKKNPLQKETVDIAKRLLNELSW